MKSKKGFYSISVVANMFEITQQTLRIYEEKGLVKPVRSRGNKRLYDERDIERIELVLRLTRELGVNLAGVEVILNLREKMLTMEKRYREIVELFLGEYQTILQRLNEEDEEGLIPCDTRNLMRIFLRKNRYWSSGTDTDDRDSDTITRKG